MIALHKTPIVVLGAGPAGLGAAWKLAQRGCFSVTVVERHSGVGGNAGSFELDGQRVDFGSHRLHPACAPDVLADIQRLLGEDLLDRPRHGRIRLRGRWLHFPLKPLNLISKLPPSFVCGVALDAATKPFRGSGKPTFGSVLERGLGRTICRDFYFPYAQKIWGVSPDELDPEQARRRVSAGSLIGLVRKVARAIPGLKPPGGGRFYYPRGGFGQICDAYHAAAVQAGATVHVGATVTGIQTEGNQVRSVMVRRGGSEVVLPARHLFSTIPITALVRCLQPAPQEAVLIAAERLRFRAMILIYLTLETSQFTEYDAHYFPDAQVRITRLSEPKNYGLRGPDDTTVLCAELPCSTDDPVWTMSDADLAELVNDDLRNVGIPIPAPVRAVATRRLPQAYPIYAPDYHQAFGQLDQCVAGIGGLTSLGRQGLFAHDNTHHTLAMAYAANNCLSPKAVFDSARWQRYREQFETHVVED